MSTHGYYHKTIGRAQQAHEMNDYGSARSQETRFRYATDALGIRSGDSVVDVGCGTGEYADWLQRNGYVVRYLGVDDHPLMVERARAKNVQIISRNVIDDGVPAGDFLVCLGVLGVIDGDERRRWTSFSKLMRHLDIESRCGFVVTMLTTRSDWSEDEAVKWYVEPEMIVQQFEKVLPNRRWQLRLDYHPFDAMIVVRKGDD